MEKIKISTLSGSMMEKPLVTAFRGNNGEYVVFDNEMNGTMGLPIILVSKVSNGMLSAVPDAEWNEVKEALRLIIAGNQVNYVAVNGSLGAQDMFYKQLTLPVASFEALKNNYKVIAPAVETTPVPEQVTPIQTQVVEPVTPVSPVAPVEPVNVVPSTPVMPEVPVTPQEVAPVMPNVEPVPEVEENVPVDFTADKEAFLKACENMFDALVAKFNNK